ncbi:MAG TPA: hypothetical protein VI489_05045 [Candidatus Brocadiaceae bacterium]
MGKQTKGIDAFKKYINSKKPSDPRKSDEHDKAWGQIRTLSTPIKTLFSKVFKFGGPPTIYACTNCIFKTTKKVKVCPNCACLVERK